MLDVWMYLFFGIVEHAARMYVLRAAMLERVVVVSGWMKM